MRVLITGGAGFIGSNYARLQLTNNFGNEISKLTVIDSLTYAGNLKNLEPIKNNSKFSFIYGDILDTALLEKIVPKQDLIINFAAETHVDNSISKPENFFRTNILGAKNLFEVCLKSNNPRIIQISTDEVYGSIDEGYWDETSNLGPSSPYSASKASADLIALSYFKTYGLNISITRCSNNYGPYQHPEKLIPLFITNLILNKDLPLYGDGSNVREWIHVDDHCRAIEIISRKGKAGEIYNIGSQELITNLELTQLILKVFNLGENVIRKVDDRLGHDKRYALNWSKVKNLGFTPKLNLREELGHIVNWYIKNQDWWKNKKQ